MLILGRAMLNLLNLGARSRRAPRTFSFSDAGADYGFEALKLATLEEIVTSKMEASLLRHLH